MKVRIPTGSPHGSLEAKRIVLIGFRGAGKSTIGKLLAKKLEWQYISTDEEIEKRENEPIIQIVKNKGWSYFRKLESEVVKEFDDSQYMVMDTGGGVVENDELMDGITNMSMVIWIDTDIENLYHRLQKAQARPLLNQNDLIEDIKINYRRRMPMYKRYSRFRFSTSVESAEEICNKIISEMR